ncbi:hypothetical protein C8J57DRAFT_1373815 [Mycena rebaudengoi]|nr:hypothetical protein C8J57DRAFT_1373815 [Mycena rebaudengoi]
MSTPSSIRCHPSCIRPRTSTVPPLQIISEEDLADETMKCLKAKRRLGASDIRIPPLFESDDLSWKLIFPDSTTLDFPRPPSSFNDHSGRSSSRTSDYSDSSSSDGGSSGPTTPTHSPTFSPHAAQLLWCKPTKPLRIIKQSASPVSPFRSGVKNDDLDEENDAEFYTAHISSFITLPSHSISTTPQQTRPEARFSTNSEYELATPPRPSYFLPIGSPSQYRHLSCPINTEPIPSCPLRHTSLPSDVFVNTPPRSIRGVAEDYSLLFQTHWSGSR